MNIRHILFILLLLVFLPVLPAQAAGVPAAYEKAKVDLSRLLNDEKKAKYRHEWLKSADAFMAVYTKNPSWNNRPAALFRSALALEEMARRSYGRKDAQLAAGRFESLAKKHPSSVLADDALYRAGIIHKELLRHEADARALLKRVCDKYPDSDYASKATAYLTGMDDGDLASLGKPSSFKTPSQGVQASVSQLTPQLKKNGQIVRIVVSADRPVNWRIQHMGADPRNGRPARLTLDLKGAEPAQSLDAGARYSKMGILSRYAVDYTAGGDNNTRILLDFSKLARYTVKAEKSPFRIIIEATAVPNLLTAGIKVGTSSASRPAPPHKPEPLPARAETPSNVAAQLGLTVKTIVIDPGHGGKDPGTSHNGIVEREMCLDLAKRVGQVLSAAGYKVVYTRDRDTWISLADRSAVAARKKGDLFLSIHVNASQKPQISGFETYFLDLAGSKEGVRVAAVENAGSHRTLGEMEAILTDLLLGVRIQESRRLASAVQESTLALLKKRGHQVKDGGTKGAPFHVLIGSAMPGVLVEVGYCSNKAEAQKLKQSAYRNALAEGIANGVHRYARQLQTAGR